MSPRLVSYHYVGCKYLRNVNSKAQSVLSDQIILPKKKKKKKEEKKKNKTLNDNESIRKNMELTRHLRRSTGDFR